MQEIHLSFGGSAYNSPWFLGEVLPSELISGDELASTLGLTQGVSESPDIPWLKFLDPVDDVTKYIAKRPFRHSLSWSHLRAADVVYGERTIVINSLSYKVRLIRGVISDPNVTRTGHDVATSHGSEWNRLFYPLIPNPYLKPMSGISGEGIVFGSWASYTEEELGMKSGNGRITLCQETNLLAANQIVTRGLHGVTHFGPATNTRSIASNGWRPVLELVP